MDGFILFIHYFFILLFTFYSLRINSSLIWNSYQLDIVLLILFLVLTKESQVLFDGYGHAKSLTIPIQKLKVIGFTIQIIGMLHLFYSENLDVRNFCILNIFVYLLFNFFAYFVFKSHKVVAQIPDKSDKTSLKSLNKYFFKFSHPLFF